MGGYLMQSMKRNPADATHSNGPYAEDWFDVYDSPQESWDGLLAFGGNDENWFRHNSTNPLKADGTTYVFEEYPADDSWKATHPFYQDNRRKRRRALRLVRGPGPPGSDALAAMKESINELVKERRRRLTHLDANYEHARTVTEAEEAIAGPGRFACVCDFMPPPAPMPPPPSPPPPSPPPAPLCDQVEKGLFSRSNWFNEFHPKCKRCDLDGSRNIGGRGAGGCPYVPQENNPSQIVYGAYRLESCDIGARRVNAQGEAYGGAFRTAAHANYEDSSTDPPHIFDGNSRECMQAGDKFWQHADKSAGETGDYGPDTRDLTNRDCIYVDHNPDTVVETSPERVLGPPRATVPMHVLRGRWPGAKALLPTRVQRPAAVYVPTQ